MKPGVQQVPSSDAGRVALVVGGDLQARTARALEAGKTSRGNEYDAWLELFSTTNSVTSVGDTWSAMTTKIRSRSESSQPCVAPSGSAPLRALSPLPAKGALLPAGDLAAAAVRRARAVGPAGSPAARSEPRPAPLG